jgi:heme-degrading monooxygenase HmoA
MIILNFKGAAILATFMLYATACSSDLAQVVNLQKVQASNPSPAYTTLVITKVTTPWYAWRSMVLNRMKGSIPEYQAIKGLKQKFYAFSENHQLFGGIYLWETEKAAQTWFNQAWFDKTKEKYGKKGIVEYYQIEKITEIAQPEKNEGNFWAVFAWTQPDFLLDNQATGLIKIITLKNDSGKSGILSLWQSKETAQKYFANQKLENTFFDTPILLIN